MYFGSRQKKTYFFWSRVGFLFFFKKHWNFRSSIKHEPRCHRLPNTSDKGQSYALLTSCNKTLLLDQSRPKFILYLLSSKYHE
jgi:hypothetical protein